ncbi:MAG: hypothetical protein WCI61_08320 [Chloroflexota bacterium]
MRVWPETKVARGSCPVGVAAVEAHAPSRLAGADPVVVEVVAGLEGVHVRSEWLPATPGQRYWLTADCLGQGGAKVFVKGFVDWRERAEAISEGSLAKRGLTPEQFAALPAEKRKALLAEETREHPELYRREVYR